MANKTKQGIEAGKQARVAVNKATAFTVDNSKSVATAVGGFFKGFFSNPEEPARKVATRKTPSTKRKATVAKR